MKRKGFVIILTGIIWSSALSACGMDTTINPTKAAEMTEFTEEALTADPAGRDKGTEKQSEGKVRLKRLSRRCGQLKLPGQAGIWTNTWR